MNSFKQKYPALAGLVDLIAQGAKVLAAQGQSLLARAEGEVVLVPGVLGYMSSGNASLLGAELSQIKSSPQDEVAAAEYAVTDCAFSSEEADELIPLAFAAAESYAAAVSPTIALINFLEKKKSA